MGCVGGRSTSAISCMCVCIKQCQFELWNTAPGRSAHAPPPAAHLRSLVRQQRVLCGLLAVGTGLELSQVAVVVALHLQVEHLRLAGGRGGDEVVVQQL
eukprot:1137578-Pelagomonas_calceolata.AAC.3